ncbi:MAG TPA: M56 family metallopeptidase [Thermoguttaceae bacterium]|nr:M56 family metallopeptidase [Thermoguttaceae bacterium]
MSAILEIGLGNALMALVLAVVAAAVSLRKGHPAVAHVLWLLVFVKLLTPPLAAVPVPVLWARPVRHVVETDRGGAAEPARTSGNPAVPSDPNGSWTDGADLPGAPDSSSSSLSAGGGGLPDTMSGLDETNASSFSATPAGASPTTAGASRVVGILIAAWLAGSLAWFGVSAVLMWRVCRLLAFARPAPAGLEEEVRRLARRLGIARSPEVRIVSGPISPMLWPIGRRARILLPQELLDRLTWEEQSTVLTHELAHVRRRDHWVRLLEYVGTGLYWWHPVVWWARAQLRRAEEECCDAWVVATLPDSAPTYAAALLKTVDLFAQFPEHRPIPDLIGSGARTTRLLERRLTMIYRQGNSLHLGRAWGMFLALLAALVLPIVPGRPSPATASQNATAEADASETSVQADAAAPADESADGPNNGFPQDANEGPPFRVFDPFDGKLALDWKPLRPDPSHVSLTRNPGKLTITAQPGSIYGDELDVEHAVAAKNIHLIPNPAPGNEGFVVTTCIESFHPKKPYQQAGLIVYNDDDNYVKWVMEHARYGPSFTFVHETNRSTVGDYNGIPNEPILARFWLRLVKRANFYQYAYSVDGEEFTVVDEVVWGDGAPQFIGILAKNDRVPDEIDVIFDYVEVRSLTAEEKNEPGFRDRQKLQGMWDVVSCKYDGKLLEELPLTRLVFAGSHVTVTEAENSLRTEYAVEVVNGWNELVLRSGLFGRRGESVRALYRLEDDTLVLGLDSRVGAPTLEELETRRGDKRFVVTLKRTPADVASAIRRNTLSMKQLFLQLDANHDGHLTREEFTADRATPVAIGRAKEVFDLADRDKDDRVTFEEYERKPNRAAFLLLDVDQDDRLTLGEASAGSPIRDLDPGRAQAVFDLLDEDDDGTLTPEEHAAPRSPEFWFVRTDRNNDGRLSLSEFSERNSGLARTSRVRRVFAALDRDGDGDLDFEEFSDNPQEVLFTKSDIDADGKLSFQEFAARKGTPEEVAAAKKAFSQKDSDGDGSLSFKEYAFRGEDAEFWKADQNGDNRINREEFEVSRIWTTAGDALAAFGSFDRNRDDTISLSEFRSRPDSTRPNAANDP